MWSIGCLASPRPLAAALQEAGDTADLPAGAIWRIDSRPPEDNQGFTSQGVNRVQFSRRGKYLATRLQDNTVRIYDVVTRKAVAEFNGHENDWIKTLDFSPDEKYLVTAAGSSEELKVWESATGRQVAKATVDARAAYFNEAGDAIVVFSDPDVQTLAWTAPSDSAVVKLEVKKKVVWKAGAVRGVAMSRDGSKVLGSRALRGMIVQSLLIDVATKQEMPLISFQAQPVTGCFSPDGQWLAVTFARNPQVRLWSVGDPAETRFTLAQHTDHVTAVSFSSDSRFLASAGRDDVAFVFEVASRQVIKRLAGHTENVNAIDFHPQQLWLASGASGATDSSALLWDLRGEIFPLGPRGNAKASEQVKQIWEDLSSSTLSVGLPAAARVQSLDQSESSDDAIWSGLTKLVLADVSVGLSEKQERWILDLQSADYEIREQATAELLAVREQIRLRLEHEYAQTAVPEVRYRLGIILKTDAGPRVSDALGERRWSRILLALEHRRDEASRSLLSEIAQGHTDAKVAAAAGDALKRREQRADQ